MSKIAHENPFFHKKVKSGRQVLKTSQNPFFLNTVTKIFFFKCWIIWAKKEHLDE